MRRSASAGAGPATAARSSYSRCGSSTPTKAIVGVVDRAAGPRCWSGRSSRAARSRRGGPARAAAGCWCCACRRRGTGTTAGCGASVRSSRWSRRRRRPARRSSRTERLEQRVDGVPVGQVVAGVDHQVGLEVGQRGQPAPLDALGRGQVQVADVQHLQRPVARRQHGHLDPAAYDEVADLDPRRVGQRAQTGGTADADGPAQGAQPARHGAAGGRKPSGESWPRLPQWRHEHSEGPAAQPT